MKQTLIRACFLAMACTLAPQVAHADGVALATSALPSAARTALESQWRAAKGSSAATSLAALRAQVAERDAQKRGRFAVFTPELKALGKDGVVPMLVELALDAKPRGALTDSAWTAWRVSLLEAVGWHRDARSAAVLEAVLDSNERDPEVLRAAAEALGKLETTAVVTKLVALAKSPGPKREAAIAGLGFCRRSASAQALADLLGQLPKADLAKAVAKALGDVSSALAWEAQRRGSTGHLGEEGTVRLTAAKALVEAFVPYGGEARERIRSAILMSGQAELPALIEAQKKASPAAAADLDALLAQVRANRVQGR